MFEIPYPKILSLEDQALHEQTPQPDLPIEGSAVPSKGTNSEGGSAGTDLPDDSMTTRPARKAPAKRSSTREDDPDLLLKSVQRKASLLIHDPAVQPDHRLILLRRDEDAQKLGLKEKELERFLVRAQADKDGRPQVMGTQRKLSRRPTRWLLEDILIKDGTNLVYAEPKCGKTRFLLAVLGALLNNETEVIGKKLFDKGEKIFIAGPDMTEQTWAEFLDDFGMIQENGEVHERIADMAWAGMNFRLDENGIQIIEDCARGNPGLIVLIDAFASCLWGLGHDENKAQVVDPLVQLMQAIAPFKATLIVIHHAKKATGETGVSGAARGSSAITAVVDQIVSMRAERRAGTDEETGVVALTTRGRASKPIALSVRQGSHGKTWESLGSPEEINRQREIRDTGTQLSSEQREILLVLCRTWAVDRSPLVTTAICRLLNRDPQTGRRSVNQSLNGLRDVKGFVKELGYIKESRGRPSAQWAPTEAGREWFEQQKDAYPDP